MTDSFDYSTGCGHKFSTLVDLLRYRALHQPDRRAYTFLLDGETQSSNLNYQQLDRLAQAIAAKLQSMGATGERALLLYPPGLEFIAAFFGCLYAGVVAVPAYPPKANQKMSRLQVIVEDSQATFALTTTPLLSNIERQFAQNPTNTAMRWLATDNIASDQASEWQEPTCKENTLAFLQYTSGSTATPKGVMISHGNLLHNSALINQCFGDTPNSLGVSWLPPYHDMGLIGGVIQPLYVGAPMILMSPVDFLQKPWRWLEAISRYKVTTSGGPNFAYDMCVRKITAQQRASLDLSSWEFAFTGAEPVRAQTLERFAATFEPCGFRREAFSPCYGMAETTLFVSGVVKTAPPIVYNVQETALEQNRVVAAKGEEGSRQIVGCGQTWEEKIAIINPESLTQCAAEQVGEIWVSGLSVAQGYWNRPEETERTFKAYLADTREGPFLRTGDLGFLQEDQLFVTGRLKDLIIIRGRNHYPQDIELTVEHSHPALRPACGAAFSVEVEGSERLVVVQEVERSYLRKLDVDEVVGAIRKAVSQEHELQVDAVLLIKTGSIPKTSSGKIQRHACRVGFLENNLTVVGNWKSSRMEPVERQNGSIGLSDSQTPNQVSRYAERMLLQEQTLVGENQEMDSPQQGNRSATPCDLKTNVLETTPTPSEGSKPPMPVNPQTPESIQNWMVDWLVRELEVEAQSIDTSKSFADYGLDSVTAVELADALQNWLGVTLSPTLAYEYPTIEFLAQYLATETGKVEEMPEVTTYQSSGNEEVDQLLAELEELSEAEVQKALGK